MKFRLWSLLTMLLVFCVLPIAVQAGEGALQEVDLASDTAWTLSIDDAAPRAIKVPGGGYNSDRQDLPLINQKSVVDHVLYQRQITIPAVAANQVTLIEFGAVNCGAVVSLVNGTTETIVATHDGPMMPFSADITHLVTPGNTYTLKVKAYPSWHYAGKMPRGWFYDEAWIPNVGWASRNAAGITKYVRVAVYPEVRVSDVFIQPSVTNQKLKCDVWVSNHSSASKTVTIGGQLSSWNNDPWVYPTIPSVVVTVPANSTSKVSVGPVAWALGPTSYWWPNKPFSESYQAKLHILNLSASVGGSVVNTWKQRFGFCEWTEGASYYLINGVRINYISDGTPEPGMCDYDAYSVSPAFLPPTGTGTGCPETWKRYMRMGICANRIHQSTPTQYMMDAADEVGFMLIPETAIRGYQESWDNTITPGTVKDLAQVCRNHPSVCRYSLMNESDPSWAGPLADAIYTVDNTRPLVFEDIGMTAACRKDGTNAHAYAMLHYTTPSLPITMITGVGETAWNGFAGTGNGPLPLAYVAIQGRCQNWTYCAGWDWINYWPNFLQGMDKAHMGNVQGGVMSDRTNGVDGWNSPVMNWVARCFHPYLFTDQAFYLDPGNDPKLDSESTFFSNWPRSVPGYSTGVTVSRDLIAFNDSLTDGTFTLRWSTRWDSPTGPLVSSGEFSGVALQAGFNVHRTLTFTAPSVASKRLLFLTLESLKDGVSVFTDSTVRYAIYPPRTAGSGTGLKGDYYEGSNLDVFRVSRTDAAVNFDWGTGSPDPTIPVNTFSTRWTGQLEPQFTATYTFYLTHNDGARLWVNNKLIIDNWTGSGTNTGTVSLTLGQKVPVKIEYCDYQDTANCKLEWQSNYQPREVVPQTQLYPDTTTIYSLTAAAGSNGTISPSGKILANSGESRQFVITPAMGYIISDVKVDGTSVGAVGSYTLSNITAGHNISAAFAASPLYAVSGKVTRKSDGSPIAGAKIGFYSSQDSLAAPIYTATTDASGNYSISVPVYTWYLSVSATDYLTTAPQAVDVTSGPVSNVNFALVTSGTRNVPKTNDLLFSCVTDSLPASGNTGNWATYLPAGQALTTIGSPTAETLMGRKWEKNNYADYDGFKHAEYSSAFPCNGITITAVVKPIYYTVGGEQRGEIVDFFHYRLWLAIGHGDGKIMVCRNNATDYGPSIPNGQTTVLSLVVQLNGSYKVYANGIQVMTGGANGDFSSMAPNSESYAKAITVGRNNADGWSTFNGYIGDVFVYKTALSDADRQALESDLTNRFISGGANAYPITATAGTGGSISPAGTINVSPGSSQTFSIAPNAGWVISDVTVDGVSVGAVTSYTFNSVNASHSITAAFVPAITYTITANAGSGGSISPNGVLSVVGGTSQTFTITPLLGYAIEDVKVDGQSVGTPSSYTFANVSSSHTITVTFKSVPVFTITASAGTGGTISPTGAVQVNSGSNQAFVITPSAGYAIADVLVDGVSKGAISTYTFNNVTASHVITATFVYGGKLNGTIIGTPGSYDGVSTRDKAFDGNTSTYFDAPNPGLDAWVGLDLGSPKIITKVKYYPRSNFPSRMSGGKFQGSNTADFSSGVVDLYTIPSTPPIAWSEQAISNASTFRYVRYLSVGNTYGNVAELEFYGNDGSYQITASAGPGGSITPSGAVAVVSGASQAFSIAPNSGYAISALSIDGASVIPTKSYTFSNVTARHTISVAFAKPIGMNNRTAITDAKAQGRVVRAWGCVKNIIDPSAFALSDGFGNNLTIRTNGAALPAGFGVGKYIIVSGLLSKDDTGKPVVYAQEITVP